MRRTALLLLLASMALTAHAEAVDMLVYAVPGLFDVGPNGSISGPGGRLLDRIGEVSGVEMRLQVMPPARVMQTLKLQANSCVAGVPRRLPESQPAILWVGLLASSQMLLYGRADETRAVTQADDLRGAVIAAQRESFPAAWLHERGLRVEEVRDTATAYRMLQARRVDYWLVNELVARHTIESQGKAAARPLQNFGHIEAFLACNFLTPASTLEKLRAAVEHLRRDGELVPFGVR